MDKIDNLIFEIFPWNRNFECGIATIDNQHRNLVKILNKLAINLANLSSDLILNEIFDELINYTGYHFKTEEKVWSKHFAKDNWYASHIAIHKSFIQNVMDFKHNKTAKPTEEMLYELVLFLSKWLAYHILDTDKRMANVVLGIEKGLKLETAKREADELMIGSMEVLVNAVLTMYNGLSVRTLNLMREKALRKKAEKALTRSEERWKFIIEGGLENVWDWDIENNQITNPKLKPSVFELINSKLKIEDSVSIHPADINRIKIDFNAHIEGYTEFFTNKYRVLRKNGSWGWILTRGKVVSRNEDGKALRMVGSHSDITERELASQIFHNSSQAFMICDMNNNIISVNPAFTMITGYTSDEAIGKNPSFLSDEKHDKSFYREMWKQIKTTQQWNGELYNKRKNGEVYPISITVNITRNEKGDIDHYFLIFNDISEKLKASAVEKSEKLFRSLVESASDWIWEVDTKGRYTYVSPRVKDILGYNPDEILGKTPFDLMPSEESGKIAHIFSQSVNDKVNINKLVNLNTHKNGNIVVLETSAIPVFSANGDLLGYRGIDRDISERKKVENELLEAKNAAESAMRIKSEFLANMSHEIRTPMNSILGYLELVLEDSVLLNEHRKYLKTAHISASSLLCLINDILDISKLESGRLTLEQHSFNLHKLIWEIHETMEIQSHEKGLIFNVEIDPSTPTSIVGDPLRLRQIIINLVGNAFKFTNSGFVNIKVTPIDDKTNINFLVEDSGIGIPAHRLKHIFEPFTQAEASTSRLYGGTGLGTTIAKKLVECMGGRIWVESQEGKGSKFHFYIPLQVADNSVEDFDLFIIPGKAVTPCFRSGFKVLLAEDIEANINLAKIRLEKQGHDVMVARNGYQVIEIFQQNKFDIILMDIHMPMMDGLQSTSKIRELEKGMSSHVPIIALTASVMSKEKEKYFQIGIDDVVAKPIHFGKLFKAMEKLIPSGIGVQMAEIEQTEKKSFKYDGYKTISGIDMQEGLETWQNLDAYIKALHGFSEDYAEIAYTISQQLNEQDLKNVRATLHKLKGISGNLKLKEVYKITVKIDALIGENRIYDAKGYLPHLTIALSEVIESIKNLEIDHVNEAPLKNITDIHNLSKLFNEMMKGFNQFNPYVLQPIISELERYLLKDQLKPIVRYIEKFEFNQAKVELINLSKKLGIILIENGE